MERRPEHYLGGPEPAAVAVEREVFGSDFGTTGSTTVTQAKLLISELALESLLVRAGDQPAKKRLEAALRTLTSSRRER